MTHDSFEGEPQITKLQNWDDGFAHCCILWRGRHHQAFPISNHYNLVIIPLFSRELFKHIPAHTKTTLPTKPENALIPALAYECQLSSIHLASYSGSDHVVRALLNQAGVEVGDKSSPSEFTPLHLACLTGHVGVVGLLISRSTDLLKATDSKGRTPLHLAADNGHFEMCQVLLGQGSVAAVEDLELWTSLHCAAKHSA